MGTIIFKSILDEPTNQCIDFKTDLGDTVAIGAGEVLRATGRREAGGTVEFVRTVATVIMAITAPPTRYAVFVVAGECSRRAGHA